MDDIYTQVHDNLSQRRKQLYNHAYNLNALITIQLPTDGVDELNANESETFTLEEYRKIILDFRLQNKDFILARVTTPDPYRQEILYNYYYIASEVNKVLFKYESSRKLLHRMKVRNPLNNMFIIGQVQYFRITKEEVDRALVDCYFRNLRLGKPPVPSQRTGISAFSAVFRTMNDSDSSLVSTNTENLSPKREHKWSTEMMKKFLENQRKSQKNKKENLTKITKREKDYTKTYMRHSVKQILQMYENDEIDIPDIPEEYINRCVDIETTYKTNDHLNEISSHVARAEPRLSPLCSPMNSLPSTKDTNQKFTHPQLKATSILKTQSSAITQPLPFKTPYFINYKAEFFATDDDFLLRNTTRDYFKLNSVDPTEDFLFELDRTENDLFAILETPSSSENEEALSWKRVLTFHLSLLLTLVGVVVLLGLNPIAVIITLPLALFVFLSFLCSIVYILCVRRSSFDSLAVESVDEM